MTISRWICRAERRSGVCEAEAATEGVGVDGRSRAVRRVLCVARAMAAMRWIGSVPSAGRRRIR